MKNETKAFLNAMNFSNRKKFKENGLGYKIQEIMNDYQVERAMKDLVQSDSSHVKLTEFLFFTFLLSPHINDVEIFTIMDEYTFGTKQNKELEQFSKFINALNNTVLNKDIKKIYTKKIRSLFTTSKKRKRYKQLMNIQEINEYAIFYELFVSFLIILVRVNELNNFSTKYLSMESAFRLTAHNRITQLTKSDNEIDWSPVLKYLNPQLRNVGQHFDVSYDVEGAVYIGKDMKGDPFEISKEDFQNRYLEPIREVIYAIVATIYLLNIGWMDNKKSLDYMNIYIDAWKRADEQGFQNYVNDLVISNALNSEKYKDLTLEDKKSLYKNDFEILKKDLPDKYK